MSAFQRQRQRIAACTSADIANGGLLIDPTGEPVKHLIMGSQRICHEERCNRPPLVIIIPIVCLPGSSRLVMVGVNSFFPDAICEIHQFHCQSLWYRVIEIPSGLETELRLKLPPIYDPSKNGEWLSCVLRCSRPLPPTAGQIPA